MVKQVHKLESCQRVKERTTELEGQPGDRGRRLFYVP